MSEKRVLLFMYFMTKRLSCWKTNHLFIVCSIWRCPTSWAPYIRCTAIRASVAARSLSKAKVRWSHTSSSPSTTYCTQTSCITLHILALYACYTTPTIPAIYILTSTKSNTTTTTDNYYTNDHMLSKRKKSKSCHLQNVYFCVVVVF